MFSQRTYEDVACKLVTGGSSLHIFVERHSLRRWIVRQMGAVLQREGSGARAEPPSRVTACPTLPNEIDTVREEMCTC